MFTKERIAAIIVVIASLLIVYFPGLFLSFTLTFAGQIVTMLLVWLLANIICKLFIGKSLLKILKEIMVE